MTESTKEIDEKEYGECYEWMLESEENSSKKGKKESNLSRIHRGPSRIETLMSLLLIFLLLSLSLGKERRSDCRSLLNHFVVKKKEELTLIEFEMMPGFGKTSSHRKKRSEVIRWGQTGRSTL